MGTLEWWFTRVERCITRGSGRKDDINMVNVETAIKKITEKNEVVYCS